MREKNMPLDGTPESYEPRKLPEEPDGEPWLENFYLGLAMCWFMLHELACMMGRSLMRLMNARVQ